jgi:hypothetical protein
MKIAKKKSMGISLCIQITVSPFEKIVKFQISKAAIVRSKVNRETQNHQEEQSECSRKSVKFLQRVLLPGEQVLLLIRQM